MDLIPSPESCANKAQRQPDPREGNTFASFQILNKSLCVFQPASFGAGAILSVVGVASIKQAQSPSQILFASIPLLFAMQQISEGFLWLSLTNSTYASLQQVTTYNFLFFAQVAWPMWVPFSILKLEPKERQRTIEKVLVGIGAIVSLYLAYCLGSYHVDAKIIGYHISYEQAYPSSISRFGSLLYVIATIAPPFFSRIKRMWMLGATVLISYVITAILYTDYIVSVWCFFASIISIAIYVIMHNIRKSNQLITGLKAALP
jgi:hypothetical protein